MSSLRTPLIGAWVIQTHHKPITYRESEWTVRASDHSLDLEHRNGAIRMIPWADIQCLEYRRI